MLRSKYKLCSIMLALLLLVTLAAVGCSKHKGDEELSIKLTCEQVSYSKTAAAYSRAAQQESYIITATVTTPTGLDTSDLVWSGNWSNPYSTWAKGKSFNNYLTLTVDPTNAHRATLTVKAAFGEPAIIYCRYAGDTSKYATCKVDYFAAPSVYSGRSILQFDCDESYTDLRTSYGTGTLKDGTLSVTYFYAELSSEAYDFITNTSPYQSFKQEYPDIGLERQSHKIYNTGGDWFNLWEGIFLSDLDGNRAYVSSAQCAQLRSAFKECAQAIADGDIGWESYRCVFGYEYTCSGYTITGEAYTDWWALDSAGIL